MIPPVTIKDEAAGLAGIGPAVQRVAVVSESDRGDIAYRLTSCPIHTTESI